MALIPKTTTSVVALTPTIKQQPDSHNNNLQRLMKKRPLTLSHTNGRLMALVFTISWFIYTLCFTRTVELQQMRRQQQEILLNKDQPNNGGADSSMPQHQSHPMNSKYLGSLHCEQYGGPYEEDAVQEMIYWREIPQDKTFSTPYYSSSFPKKETKGSSNINDNNSNKFLSVEIDAGGFNNIRMTVEIAMALAHATGRTFVVPPKQGLYLMSDTYTLHDFYNLDGLDVIELKDFLEQQVLTGKIRDSINGTHVLPPYNRTNWSDGYFGKRDTIWENENSRELDHFMRSISTSPQIKPEHDLVIVPREPEPSVQLEQTWQQLAQELRERDDGTRQSGKKYVNNPTPVDASVEDRLEEMFTNRNLGWIYSKEIHDNVPLVHFMADDKKGIRMHSHFYHALFFEDWQTDLAIKRYVRDKLRYRDEFFCAGGRIVQQLREISKKSGNEHGQFYTYHVRRNDFAHINLVPTGDTLLSKTQHLIPPNATVYIATDEKDKSWFDPLKQYFHHGGVYFLDDFMNLLGDNMNSNYYGIIDQIVASRGEIFMGAYYSTMTMQIMHMKGYYSQLLVNKQKPGHSKGTIKGYYYNAPTTEEFNFFQQYQSFGEYWIAATAFPIAWRDIDNDII